ncbi:dipeptide ABC transporter ATP-binding protein [Pseudaestuariivita sp.]|uniref:dipeptide ABC transporter ATP-binding protein n=1 Tax=Pseudaestuariivita sp. TaxID=2211669 RepID=UPI0040587EBB
MSSSAATAKGEIVLDCRDVGVSFAGVSVVDRVSLELRSGVTTAIVGESGSGKSQLVKAITGLSPGDVTGSILYRGTELVGLPEKALSAIRGRRIAYVFQDPMSALNPYLRIDRQLGEVAETHLGMSRQAARARALDLLRQVQMPEPEAKLRAFPHELSGGQRQRVVIAAALMADPEILIADEPTTALDATVQLRILDLLGDLARDRQLACAFITHDIAVAARIAERTLVMQSGRMVEEGPTHEVLSRPQQDYTRTLLRNTPSLSREIARPPAPVGGAPLLEAKGLGVRYTSGNVLGGRRTFQAVRGVDFSIAPSETLGIVGESGSGKSTIIQSLLRLAPVSEGEILWRGAATTDMDETAFQAVRREVQIVFQDPLASLNPRMPIHDIVAEPLWTHFPELTRAAVQDRVREAMDAVGLPSEMAARFPHTLSGGQAQRVGIARAIVSRPAMLICDEAVSALDVTVQARVLDLIVDLQRQLELAILFISHDMAVVRQVADRVLVLETGEVRELAPRDQIFEAPRHPYTRKLLDAVLSVDTPKQEVTQ